MIKKKRTKIPTVISRKIKIEAGHQCGIWRCRETEYLQQHHIDGNPSNHDPNNIILLCRQHHALADDGKITELELTDYKRKLKDTIEPKVEIDTGTTPEIKYVDLNYPSDSGLQTQYEQKGYILRWSSNSLLARRLDIDGWKYAYQNLPNGKHCILKVKDQKGDLTLIVKTKDN